MVGYAGGQGIGLSDKMLPKLLYKLPSEHLNPFDLTTECLSVTVGESSVMLISLVTVAA